MGPLKLFVNPWNTQSHGLGCKLQEKEDLMRELDSLIEQVEATIAERDAAAAARDNAEARLAAAQAASQDGAAFAQRAADLEVCLFPAVMGFASF